MRTLAKLPAVEKGQKAKHGRRDTRRVFRRRLDMGAWSGASVIFILAGIKYLFAPLLNIPVMLHVALPLLYFRAINYVPTALTAFFSALLLLQSKRIRIDRLGKIMAASLAVGTAVGVIRQNDWGYFAADFINIFQGWVILLVVLSAQEIPIGSVYAWINRLILCGYSIGLATLYGYSLLASSSFYAGVGSHPLVLSFSLGLTSRNWVLVLWSVLLIVLSGKRATLVASVIVFASLLLVSKRRERFALGAVGFGASLAAVTILPVALTLVQPGTSSAAAAFARWEYLLPWSADFDINRTSNGRIAEAASAYTALASSPLGLLVGGGLGFSYTLYTWVGQELVEVYNHNGVHISPIGVLVLFGAPLTFILFSSLLQLLWRIWVRLHKASYPDRNLTAAFAVSIGLITYSFFAFELFRDPLLWISLGYLSRRAREM